MNTIQQTFNALAEESSLAENLSIQEGQSPVPISQPIDIGADKLLRDYKNAWLTYPPLEVEYLVQTLNEHLTNCIEVRLKAQDLEIKAFSETSDQLLQRKLSDTLKNQLKLFAENEPKLLGNTINAKYQQASGTITGDNAQDYWKNLLKEQEDQLKYKNEDADNRLARLSEAGSGNNYAARFEFLKKLFETDLIEAYCRARAASVGLKAIYEIDNPVPEITDIGYLDKLILWARGITYSLEKKFFNIRETTVAIALNDNSQGPVAAAPPVYDVPRIMTLDTFRLTRTNGGAFIFNIPEDFFKRPNLKLKNPRLKGIDVSVVGAEGKQPLQFWRISVKLPVKKINIAPGVLPYSHEPLVYIPMATYPAHVADMSVVPNQREVNNVNPVGEWTVRIEPKSILGSQDTANDYVDNLLIRMRIAYDKD